VLEKKGQTLTVVEQELLDTLFLVIKDLIENTRYFIHSIKKQFFFSLGDYKYKVACHL